MEESASKTSGSPFGNSTLAETRKVAWNYLLTVLKVLLFWMLIFLMNRLCFIIFFQEQLTAYGLPEVLSSLIHGLRMDISMACYLLIIPIFFLIIQQAIRIEFFRPLLITYAVIVILIDAFISIFDMGIYHDWHTHLNYRAISYLHYANEASAFSDTYEDIKLAVLLIIQIMAGLLLMGLFFKRISYRFPWNRFTLIPGVLFYAVLFPLLFIGIRGGTQLIPLNESSAYFSSTPILNAAAVNVLWNAGKKFSDDHASLHSNPYHFFPPAQADSLVRSLYNSGRDSTIKVLTTDHPNIVLFVLESFTADVIQSLGGEPGVTPVLDSLISKGLLFTRIYSQGYRTDQGLADVLSGFPATPNFSIMFQPDKYAKLSYVPAVLAKAGYHNSFYYGGELDFANMKAYLLQSGISELNDKSSYKNSEMNAKWGAHDEFVFRKQLNEMNNRNEQEQPFFSVILSLSSHEPFEVPIKARFPGNDLPSKFKSTCFYTDHCIGQYLDAARNAPWYKNTLFLFVADHGHILPRNRNPEEPARFHIPIIFYGDVLKPEFRGKKIDNIGMQSDLPSTILSQLNLPDQQFHWSNDLLNFYRNNFAYYSFDAGFGFMNKDGFMRYDFGNAETVLSGKQFAQQDIDQGKAFLQKLFEEYVSY